MNSWRQHQQEVIDTALRMEELGLVIGTSGNVSIRAMTGEKESLFAITPTSRAYHTLSCNDIPVLDLNCNIVTGDTVPSIEANLHAGIYRARPDIHAVIHTHSTYASAVAVTGNDIPPILDDQVIYLGGIIRCARYGLVGSKELAEYALEALGDRCAVILRNHGAVGCGKGAQEALENCRLLEKTARIFILAQSHGEVIKLEETAMSHDLAIYVQRQFSNSTYNG